MNGGRNNRRFAIGLALGAVILAAEGVMIYKTHAAARAAEQRVRALQLEADALIALQPAPNEDIAAAIQADLTKAQRTLATMERELTARRAPSEVERAAKRPAKRSEAFFDLATFVERMRELARKRNVAVAPDAARFGFATYAREGPEPERIAAVFRQREIVQHLLETLFEARPHALLAVRREWPLTPAEREQPAAARDLRAHGPDYFALDPRARAGVAGRNDGMAFRLTFTGETAVLRDFLRRLHRFELPVLVREVEVDTATDDEIAPIGSETSADAAATDVFASGAASVVLAVASNERQVAAERASVVREQRSPAATPIVPKTVSRFIVTVEHIDFVAPAEGIEP